MEQQQKPCSLLEAMAAPVTPGLPWHVRAVQLDLARQMEPVDFLCRYAEFAARVGFNALVLYLEGRVRTDSFPYRPREESYTLEEMAQVVRAAHNVGVEVVPALQSLGHVAQIVGCPEMRALAEEREGGRRFPGEESFCASQEGTYTFLERYFAELAQVFTSEHWHIGCDEVWNMGYCPACRQRWHDKGLGSIFLSHLQRMEHMGKAMGKRLWIWDDMIEYFPEVLDDVPRSLVLCHWVYEPLDVHGKQAHFLNRERKDWLAEYARRGLDALVCPWAIHQHNITQLTDYARRYPVRGGLLTQWAMSRQFHGEILPAVAFTGQLWSAASYQHDAAWHAGMQAVLPGASPELEQAVRLRLSVAPELPGDQLLAFLRGALSPAEHLQRTTVHALHALLEQVRPSYQGVDDGGVLDDLSTISRIDRLCWELRALLPAVYDPRRPADDTPRLREALQACREEAEQLADLRAWQHAALRAGLYPADVGAKQLRGLVQRIDEAIAHLVAMPDDTAWMLQARLFLPDCYGSPQLRITVCCGRDEQVVADGQFKTLVQFAGEAYTLQVPFTSACTPDGLRVEGWGYGGQGMTYVDVFNRHTVLAPRKVRAFNGPVSTPEALLTDNSTWAYLGRFDIRRAYHHPELADEHGVIELLLG
jgi:hypothetical protein